MNETKQNHTPEPAIPDLIAIRICKPCLNGEGQECHTPGCALFLHRVDLPIDPALYKVLPDSLDIPNPERAIRQAREALESHEQMLSNLLGDIVANRPLNGSRMELGIRSHRDMARQALAQLGGTR